MKLKLTIIASLVITTIIGCKTQQSNSSSNNKVVSTVSNTAKKNILFIAIDDLKPLLSNYGETQMITPNFDGDLTIFNPTEDMPFSPFRGVYDEQKITFLTKLIVTAVKLSSPKFDVESEHISAINKALKLAYLSKSKKLGLVYQDGDLVKMNEEEIELELSMDDVIAIRDADNLVLNRLARESVIFSADSIRSGAIKSAVNSLSVAQANHDVGLKPHDFLAHSTSIRIR